MNVSNAVSIVTPFTANQEGFSASPYPDVNGYAIGYGNHYYEDGTPVTADDDPISQARGQELLNYFLSQTASEIVTFLGVQVSDTMLAALTDLGYNWGTVNLQQSVVLSLINNNAGQDAITTQWNKTAITSGGQPNSDLVRRRAAESNLAYQSGDNTLGTVALALAAIFIGFFIYSAVSSRS